MYKGAKIEATVTKIINNSPNAFIEVRLHKVNDFDIPVYKTVKARLSFNGTETFIHNSVITAYSTLKPFRSRKNEFGLDSENFAFRNHIYFKGRISDIANVKVEHFGIQSRFREFTWRIYQDYQLAWLYYSLTTGDKSKITPDVQSQIREMGLSHLLAISGLHVAIVFGWCFFVAKVIFHFLISLFKIEKCQANNLHNIYCVLGLILTLLYVVLSGASVSAQRAFIMLVIAGGSYVTSLNVSLWRILAIALLVVLLFDPFALLDPGLYFSFIAVATIFSVLSKLQLKGVRFRGILQLLTIQAALFISLAPITAFYFQGASISGFFINILVIPLLSIVIFPFIMFAAVTQVMFTEVTVLNVVDHYLNSGLQAMYGIFAPYHWQTVAKPSAEVIISFFLCVSLYVFKPFRIYCVLPMIITSLNSLCNLSKDQWRVDIFDVGHGTSVLITSGQQSLLYDLGAKYFGRFSLFESVVLSAINGRNLTLTHTIISHLDKDHAGGRMELYNYDSFESLAAFHQKRFEQPCEIKQISMGRLEVKSYWPLHDNLSRNNGSCVVKVSGPGGSILLVGDIEHKAEKALIDLYSTSLESDILLIPHHGSHTSSTPSFIDAVNPKVGIFSRGYYSPWKLPSPLVTKRYVDNEVELFDTALHGQITILISPQTIELTTARQKQISWVMQRRFILNDWNI